MNNDWTWLDELPDYGAAEVLEKEQQVEQVAAPREPLPLPIPGAAARSREDQQGDLRAFLIAGKYEDAEVTERLKQDPMLEGLNARRKKMDGLNSRAVAGQMVMQYAFPELKQEPGAYFMKVGKELPELQTRTEAYAAVYDDYMSGVEKEYQGVLQRRAAWQQHKNEVSQAVVDVVNGRVSPAQLASRLTPEQQEVYAKEFDGAAIEKAGVAMGMVRGAFAESVEDGLKQMVNQGLANGVVAALSDADAETGELVLNEAAVKFFEGALFSLAKEAKEASGENYKFLHNMLLALGNPVRRRSVDIQSVLSMGVKADTAAALALAGEDAASKQVQGELQVDIDELKRRWNQEPVYARLRGMLDAAQAAGNETAETADFLAGTVNALGSVIGQTAPFFVPVVGTPVAFLQAYDEKRNAAYYKGLPEGTAEWSAFIDAATSVTVEKIAYGSVGRISGTGWLLSKIPGYSSARATLLGSFYARAALEVGAGAVEESALEPTAEALLQWGLRNGVFSWVGVDVGGKYSWREYREELKAMFKPEQLAATVLFGAGLTGVQSPMIKQAAEGYSKHVEHLMAQGISREEARNISTIADADERVAAAVQARAEAWKDPAAAQANQLVAATMFREIDEARAFWEAEAYKRAQSELNLPKVENVAGKSDRFLITTFDRESGAQLFSGEVGTEQLLAMLGHYVREEERMRIHHAQSAMGANALLRAAEQSGEVVVEDMAEARNPETGERVISEAGAMGVEEFKYAAELALDELEVRKASGMSEQEALATPFAALSRYMPLGNWLHLAKAFEQRLQTARETTGEQEADATRVLNATPAAGTTKADTLLLAARGQVEAREVLEDGIEHAQKKVTGNDPAKMRAWHALLRDAQKAVKQLGFKLDFYQGRDDMSAAELQAKMTEGMSKLASSYVLLNAEALPLPGWVKDLVKWHMAQLEDAQAIVQLAEAYKQGRERGNITQELEDVLAEIGQATAGIFRTAQLEAADVQAYKDARARYRTLTGDVSPTVSEIQQEQQEAEKKDAERVRSDEDVKSVQAPRADGSMDEQTFSPAADLPEEVRGAFPSGACYNVGARAWLGMVPVNKLHLSPDAPQVKKGSNKKGVVNPLVGDYRQDAPAVYVWQRKNGTLEVISGRHRLDLAKRTNTEMIAAYVYPEDAEHDAKWARLLDYEQNMQDDQADELTAATYVRETGLSDAELTRRGLTRGGSKSARGILIGREAREDLWSRFASRSINPMLAEAICKLTMHIPDKSRIDAMQAMAASDLAAGKSLDRVAAKLQLMAHAEADGEGVQGMLSFGASFDEALERSAEFIEQSLAVINKHIAAVTKARSLGQTGVSEAEGITVGLDMDPKQRLAELNELKAAYEKCGFHEHIRFRALTWDGKSAVDPIGDYAKDKAAAAELSGPTAEELEQQARDAAAEATGTFGFSTYTSRVLHRAYATDVNGNKLGADTFITTPNGNLNWYEFPKDDKTQRLLTSKGIKSLPIRLRIGRQNKSAHSGYGLIHLLNHYDDYSKIGETPLLHLFNTLANLVKIRGGAFGRYDFKGEYGGKDSKLVAQLVEEDGCYSIVSCYPVQMNRRPQAGELVIGRVLFQFPTNSETAQVLGGKTQGDAVTASAGTNGQASEEKVTQSPAQVNIYDVQIRDSSGKVIFQQPVESGVNFSVIGPRARTWDKYDASRKFKGRDDGKMRVEIDASQAKLKQWQGAAVLLYHRMVGGELSETTMQAVRDFSALNKKADKWYELADNRASEEELDAVMSDEEWRAFEESKNIVKREISGLLKRSGAIGTNLGGRGSWTDNDRLLRLLADSIAEGKVSAEVETELREMSRRAESYALEDMLDFAELYEAYPELKDMHVQFMKFKEDIGGRQSGTWIDLSDKLSAQEDILSVLLHEVQHRIQDIEGFARGGNDKMARSMGEGILDHTKFWMDSLMEDLRWFSAVEIARDYLKTARRIRKYKNAWKYNSLRYKHWRYAHNAEEIREEMVRDIAKEYEEFRKKDDSFTKGLANFTDGMNAEDYVLPDVYFSSIESIEQALNKLDGLKSRKLTFRGEAAKKNRRLTEIIKRHHTAEKVMKRFGYEPYELYLRLAGEIESRNVQARADWSAEQRADRPFNETLEYPGEALVSFSVTSMANAAQGLLEGGAMEVTRAAELVKDFNAQIANWNRVAAGKSGRADARTGAEMFGAVQALLSSARRVLPDGYRANVYTQMQWAAIYAGMAETGQLPAEGALKGNAKIMEAFRKKMLEETAMAANAQEVEDMLADIGERKLNEVMVKVLQKVRGQLVKYAKAELWEKMGRVIAYAKSKEEQGKKSKRGKMSAVDYAKLARYEEMLAMDPDRVREELDGLQGKLSKANADRTAELEAEMQELSLYGGWKGMSLQQAHAAYQAMVLFCATGRNSWKRLLDRRKAEIEWLAKEMSKALPTDRTMSGTRHAENTKLRKALAKLPYGTMSYSQLMLALSSRLGEGFCFERIEEMTEANVALMNAEKDRMKWLYGLVQQVSGQKGEMACEKWLAAFDEQVDTGIKLSPMAWCEVTMTLEEADAWLALGKEEREKLWAERDAEEKRLKRSLREERPMVPEALLPELRKQLKEYRANERKRSGKVTVRGEYMDKGRARTLVCSRDAALYAILLHEQADYQTVFGRPGEVQEAGLLYREGLDTPEKIQKLYDFVGPAGLRYGYALREKLHEQGLSVAQVWEAREGTPFRFRDNYFRASFDRLAIQDKNPLTDSNVSGVGGGKYGMLINRVAHHQEAAKWDQGASMVFLAASMEQDNYIYTSHITDRWRKLLLQREFANKLKAYLGEDVMKKLVSWLDVIDGAPLDNLRAFMNLGHWQGFFTGAFAMSVLSGNGYVLMKQSSALLHGYAAGYVAASIREQEDGVREVANRHIGFLEFLSHALGGGPISDKELEESKYFRARRIEKGRGVVTVGMQDAGRKRSSLGWLSERTGELIERLDAWINRKSARALANAAYAASKKLNAQHGNLLTEEQLKEGALQAVGRMMELGAQPLTRTQKSMFQNGSGLLGKLTFAMKSESINKLGLMSAQVVRGERVAPINAWLAFGVFNAAIAFLIAKLQGNDDDEGLADDVISGVVSTLTGPLSAVPVLSEGIAELASLITGERVYSSNLGKQILDVGGIARGIKKLYRHHDGERELSWEQYFQAVTTLLRASGAGFGAFARSGSEALSSWGSLALSAAAGANLSRVAKDVLCTVGLLERKEEKKKKKKSKKK